MSERSPQSNGEINKEKGQRLYRSLLGATNRRLDSLPVSVRKKVTSVSFSTPAEASIAPSITVVVGRTLDDETIPVTVKDHWFPDAPSVGLRPDGGTTNTDALPPLFMNFAENIDDPATLLEEAHVSATIELWTPET